MTLGQLNRATSPMAATFSRANRFASTTTPLSKLRPEPSSHSKFGNAPTPSMTAWAPIVSPPSRRTTNPSPRFFDVTYVLIASQLDPGVRRESLEPRRDVRTEYAEERPVERFEHDRHEPATLQLRRHLSADESAAYHHDATARFKPSSSGRSRSSSSRLRSVSISRRQRCRASRRARAPVAITMCDPPIREPFSSSTRSSRDRCRSATARTPRRRCHGGLGHPSGVASVARSTSHLPASTCLESGGRSYGA